MRKVLHLHFAVEETESQRGKVICYGSHSQETESGLNPGSPVQKWGLLSQEQSPSCSLDSAEMEQEFWERFPDAGSGLLQVTALPQGQQGQP